MKICVAYEHFVVFSYETNMASLYYSSQTAVSRGGPALAVLTGEAASLTLSQTLMSSSVAVEMNEYVCAYDGLFIYPSTTM